MFKKQLSVLEAYDPGPSIETIKAAYGLEKIVKLDSNENAYGASPLVAETIVHDALLPSLYPDSEARDLREQLAEKLDVRQNQLIFSSGLDEMIEIASRALLTPGDNIVMAWPTFYEYYSHALIEGAEIRRIDCDKDGRHDVDKMLAAVDDSTKIIWICNPNNPTGTYVNEEKLAAFLNKVPKSALVIIDEAYYDYVTADDFPDTLSLLKRHANVMVLRTFSKAYGLASFRIAYAIARPELIQELEKVRLPFNTTGLSQVAALAALKDEAFIKKCRKKNRKVLKIVRDFFDKHDISYYPSQTNFIYIKTADPKDVFERCQKNGFLIRPFENGVRITMGKKRDMLKLLKVLEDILTEYSSKAETLV